jgi:hypothetical protein
MIFIFIIEIKGELISMKFFENVSFLKVDKKIAIKMVEEFLKNNFGQEFSVKEKMLDDGVEVLKNNKRMELQEIKDFIVKIEEMLFATIQFEEEYFDEGLILFFGLDMENIIDSVIKFVFGEKMVYMVQAEDDDEGREEVYRLLLFRGELPTDLISILAYFKLSN